MLTTLLTIALLAQPTLSVTVPPDTAFQVSFDLPGTELPNFRWWCDGGIVKNYAGAQAVKNPVANVDGSFSYALTVPGLSVGTHSCFVSAFNDLGEAKSVPITVPVGVSAPVGAPPKTPINLRIIVQVGG